VKKLLALLVVGSLLGLVTGCPPAPTTAPKEKEKEKPKETEKDKNPPKETSAEGKFKEWKEDKLTVDVDGKPKDFDVKGVKPMLGDKEGKWDDLKAGDKVTVSLDKDGKVTKVVGPKAGGEIAPPKPETVEGKVKEDATADKLILTVDGKDKEFDVKGVKDYKPEDFKKDAKAKVTTEGGKVTKVEKGA